MTLPIRILTAGVCSLGMTAIAAHQFPKRWRQNMVMHLPRLLGTQIERVAGMRRPLWLMARTASVIGIMAGGILFSYALLIKYFAEAATAVAVLTVGGANVLMPYVSPGHIPGRKFVDQTLDCAHRAFDQLSKVQRHSVILGVSSLIMLIALWTFGRATRFSLDALYPPYPESSDISLE